MVSLRRQLIPSPQVKDLLVLLLVAALVVQALWYLIPTVWAPVWQEGGLGYNLINVVISEIPILDHAAIYLFSIGIFAGSSVLWVVDTYRRFPGVVLWMAILVGGFLFFSSGYNFSATDLRVGMTLFVTGFFLGLQAGGLPIIKRYFGDGTRLLGAPPHRMQQGIRITSGVIVILAVSGVLNHHFQELTSFGPLQNIDSLLIHTVSLLIIFLPLAVFTRYREPEHIIQLGPARSGKTTTQGGLFLGLEERSQHKSPLLEEIVNDYMNSGKFPERTKIYNTGNISPTTLDMSTIRGTDQEGETGEDAHNEDVSIIEFTYYTQDILFPKEKVVTTVDYPGELLTGTENGEINPLSEYLSSSGDKKSWESAISYLRDRNDELEPRKLMRHVGYLIEDAEYVVFTVPMDDYLGPIVQNRPDNVPEYHRDVIWQIREGTDNNDSGTTQTESMPPYQMRLLTDRDWTDLEKDGDKFYPVSSTAPGFTPNRNQWLGRSEAYYVRNSNRRGREHPDQYLYEYRDIIDELDGTDHKFMWLATMADLVYEDFKKTLEAAREYDLQFTQRESIEVDTKNKEINIGRSEIGQEGLVMLQNGLLSSEEPVDPATKREEYVLFSRWIREEYLSWHDSRFEDWFDQTFESHVFPVWFDIQQESREKQFVNSDPPMHGTGYVTDRFRGRYLKESYAGGYSTVTKAWLRRDSTETLPESRMAYQILQEVQRVDIE